jgi:hypothetical protein
MGATVNAYWPGMTDEQFQSHPPFFNDCKAWGNWMAEREDVPAVEDSLRRLGAEALLSCKTEGWEDEDVDWVSPRQLREAALRLRWAVLAGAPETAVILETYARNSNGIYPVAEEFVHDLDDIAAAAEWAEREGAKLMTLEVNW